MDHTAWADINLSALSHNLTQARRCALGAGLIAMVKADAYGHGLVAVGRALANQADKLGVARISEAQTLRDNGINAPILMMGTLLSEDTLRYCAAQRIAVAVHTLAQAKLIADLKLPLEVWLKLDTGMNRLGLSEPDLRAAHHLLSTAETDFTLRLMTHFSSADDHTQPITNQQIAAFQRVAADFPTLPCSLANSAAIIATPHSHGDWVRPGIMLYGSNPTTVELDLKPVMSLKSRVLAIKQVPKGQSVGYNCTWTAKHDSTIAAVGIGYGDGYPRQLPNGTPVLIRGHRFPLAGRISMDICSVDISSTNSQIEVGDEVTLWGEGLPADEIAQRAGTISYHLFTGVTSRVPRQYR